MYLPKGKARINIISDLFLLLLALYICGMGTIGQTLLQLREFHGQSRITIAKVAELSGSSYADIERGHREASFIVIFRICRFYEISLQEFSDIVDPGELERRELSSLRMIEKRAAKEF